VLGLGTFVDDVKITGGAQTLVDTSFESGTLAPFQVGAPPPGSPPVSRKTGHRTARSC
jgi:hypothetical protein